MKWILVVWLVFSPDTTGTIETADEGSCLRALDAWESISHKHEGMCVYGYYEEIANGQEDSDTN
jgi:hypothetical protein